MRGDGGFIVGYQFPMATTIERMKAQLRAGLTEWLGFDIPDEGTEDYQAWVSRAQEIDDISTFEDVYTYFSGNDEVAEDFFRSFGIDDFRSVI